MKSKGSKNTVQRHKMHHFPPYSRAEEQINEKSMIFEPPAPARPRGAPSRTHTFQWFLRARGPLKIMPSLKRQHHFTRTMPILWREHHYHPTRTPSFLQYLSSGRARGPGAGIWGRHQPPAPCVVHDHSQRTESTRPYLNPQAHHAAPSGAADFPCLRQLPPPPKKQ